MDNLGIIKSIENIFDSPKFKNILLKVDDFLEYFPCTSKQNPTYFILDQLKNIIDLFNKPKTIPNITNFYNKYVEYLQIFTDNIIVNTILWCLSYIISLAKDFSKDLYDKLINSFTLSRAIENYKLIHVR